MFTDDELRQRILLITYQARQDGKGSLQIPDYRRALGLDDDENIDLRLSNEIGYLAQRYLLSVRKLEAAGRRFPLYVVLGLTANGIDIMEKALRNNKRGDEAVESFREKLPGLRDRFKRTIWKVHKQNEQRGTVFGTQHGTDLIDAAIAEVEARVQEAGSSLRTALSNGWQPSETLLRETLNTMMQPQTGASSLDAIADVRNAASVANENTGHQNPTLRTLSVGFESRLIPTLERAIIQEYEALSLGRVPKRLSDASVQIFGPVGAVQFGQGSVAHSIQLDSSATSAVLTALKEFRDAVPTSEAASIVAVAESAEEELRQAGATDKFRRLLEGVATLVQTAGAAQPAYEMLRAALQNFGIQLPPLPTSSS